MKPRSKLMYGGTMLLAALAVIVLALTSDDGARTPDPEAPGSVRTINASFSDFAISQPGQPLHALIKTGTPPATPTLATVLSDENCQPDAEGVSHCTNAMRLDDGTELEVMHAHRMAEVPCLSPGERVLVQAA